VVLFQRGHMLVPMAVSHHRTATRPIVGRWISERVVSRPSRPRYPYAAWVSGCNERALMTR